MSGRFDTGQTFNFVRQETISCMVNIENKHRTGLYNQVLEENLTKLCNRIRKNT